MWCRHRGIWIKQKKIINHMCWYWSSKKQPKTHLKLEYTVTAPGSKNGYLHSLWTQFKMNIIPEAVSCFMKAERWMFISGLCPCCLRNSPRTLPIKGVWNGALSLVCRYTEHRGRFVCKAARVILSNWAGGAERTIVSHTSKIIAAECDLAQELSSC